MIDPRIIKLLQSNDVEKRKKAVMALAKTKDSDALPYLAKVYKSDKSEEVRQLARKGGVYIKQQMEQAAPVVEEESYDDDGYGYEYEEEDDAGYGYDDDYEDDYNSSVYYDADEDEEAEVEDAPLPSEIKVSAGDEKRAASYIDQAMDWNIRGDNEKAAELINRAMRLNPQLMYDSYTVSLASTVTGLDGQAAIDLLKPTAEELKKKSSKGGSAAAGSSVQRIFGLVTSLAALIALVSFLLFPWLDLSSVPVSDADGQTETLGAALDMLDDEMGLEGLGDIPPEFQGFIDAARSITAEVNGMDTTLVAIGQKNILDAMGFTRLFEALFGSIFGEMLGELGDADIMLEEMDTLTPEPDPLNYSLVLVPIAALLAAIIGIIFSRRPSVSGWLLMIIFGVMGVAPMLYFYVEGINTVLGSDTSMSLEQFEMGDLVIPDPTTLLGFGFWVSLGAMLAVFLLPFIAMLIMPAAPKEEAA